MPQKVKYVVISSTARDLPEHRKEVMDACLRQGMFPKMMEQLPASDAEAISASLKLVDEADIYVGVFAHRYGYVPAGHDISVTEMEYNRAVELNIPRLIFVIDENNPLGDFTISDIDTGENAAKLAQFKTRVGTENIVNFFKSPADLRAHVVNSLSQLRQPDLQTFHYISAIPTPPEPFIAHPYTLLKTGRLIGRQEELGLLTDWVSKPGSDVFKARVLNVVAIGGLGKSALTWKWFNDIAPQEMKPLAGRVWWSFYESDATFENFVTRTLAYVSRRPLAEVQRIPAPDRETQLLTVLNREPFLVVLDGLERKLVAYARMDAARLDDSQVDNQRTLRKTADPRAGRFLKRLAQVTNSRILVSTRLYPAELEREDGDPLPGSFRRDLTGLTDEDAVELWRAFNLSGARDQLLPIFATFDKHPLLIQALAGEVKRYRPAPGNLEEWGKANPRFDPAKFPLLQDAMSHVLEFALRGLADRALRALQTIAAFRMPARYDTLVALFIGKRKVCADERELDEVLTELEERGLIGWDKRANRYDLHPIVRGVVWGGLDEHIKRGIYGTLRSHFESIPAADTERIKRLEDLSASIELYNTLVGLGRYSDAYNLFSERLRSILLYKLGAYRQTRELLESLCPHMPHDLSRLNYPDTQIDVLRTMARVLRFMGYPEQSARLHRYSIELCERRHDDVNLHQTLSYYAEVLRGSGAIYRAEVALRKAVLITREQWDIDWEAAHLSALGRALTVRGKSDDAVKASERGLRISSYIYLNHHIIGRSQRDLALNMLRLGRYDAAQQLAERSWASAQDARCNFCLVESELVKGEVASCLGHLAKAEKHLHGTLTRARATNLVMEEPPILVGLAEVRRRQGDAKAARSLLDDLWEATERGPYPLVRADAFNVLAQIERDEKNEAEATEAARKAYRSAWCDGPPYAYHWGLERAKGHLRELGAGEPLMPAFDEKKFEAMPEVEIDPEGEFHVGRG